MNIHKLQRIFHPQRIAVIGMSLNPNSVSGKLLGNLIGSSFGGVVYPVSASCESVLGVACFSEVRSLPKTPDLGIICSAAEQVPSLVRECGESGIFGLMVVSAGFRETGAEGMALEAQIAEEAKRFPEMSILGPNCLGFIVPALGLNASFAPGMPKKGNIAFFSQSGALCSSVLDWAMAENLGFSYFVSIGNSLDVDFGDLIDYFGEDESTRSIILYIESIGDARKFMSAARAFSRTKPIVAYKAGRFPESAEVASSHTGAMAAEDAVYHAAFQRVGLARVMEIGDIFDCVELIGRQKMPHGERLGIVTNAGGPGVMATDALIAAGGVLAQLSEETIANLNDNMPPFWSHRNPVDVLGDARSKRIAKAVEILIEDKTVDAVLVILTPQAMTNPSPTAKAVGELAAKSAKPILASWLGGRSVQDGRRILTEAGVPSYATPEQAIKAFMTLVDYARNREILYETPKEVEVSFPRDRQGVRNDFLSRIDLGQELLTEESSKQLLADYGIPIAKPQAASSADAAVVIAEKIGFPVVLKILSPDITHKSDVGGVVLNLSNAEMVRHAFTEITTRAASLRPDAQISGVTVQPQVQAKHALEVIAGIKKDRVFGTVIMVGRGGTAAEIFADRALGLPPLNERLARRMLESLKIWRLLIGYRGQPPLATEKLIEIMIRLSYIAADFPEIAELDINPLLVMTDQIMTLDARVVLDRETVVQSQKTYAHIVMRPYPEEYVKPAQLKDGQDLIMRPIKPEDEPLWLSLLGSCSQESIYARFRYMFHWQSHDVAARYCFIDYDREMAIVAEINSNKRRLIGVGRLVADPVHRTAEYAVLISDQWQNRGLGGLMTEYCIQIAKDWGVSQIVAQTTPDNPRMIQLFQKHGFELKTDESGQLMEASLKLK